MLDKNFNDPAESIEWVQSGIHVVGGKVYACEVADSTGKYHGMVLEYSGRISMRLHYHRAGIGDWIVAVGTSDYTSVGAAMQAANQAIRRGIAPASTRERRARRGRAPDTRGGSPRRGRLASLRYFAALLDARRHEGGA